MTAALATAATLVLAWIAAWTAGLSAPMVVALSISILVVAVCMFALRAAMLYRKRPALDESRGARVTCAPRKAIDEPLDAAFSAPLHGKRWSLEVFATIDAKRFAAVCETWFSWAGFDTRSEAHRTDEGVDIWLHAAKVPGPVAIVRCKHWLDRPVGVQELKDFLAVMAGYKSVHGTYTTTSTYTPEALQFAKEHGIDAVDGRGLLRRIQTRTRQRQQALLAVAYTAQP
ncbi:MAG: restriction endonuclease [Rhodoferax sp.]|nr:restriction endonuclease [Rhodoferax sp.]